MAAKEVEREAGSGEHAAGRGVCVVPEPDEQADEPQAGEEPREAAGCPRGGALERLAGSGRPRRPPARTGGAE